MPPPTSPSTERAPWRFLRGFTSEEIARAFERAEALSRNFDPRPGGMVGFRHVCSRSRIVGEPPGAPLPDGPFENLWEAIRRFEHSDPRIVQAHIRPGGRIVLLELKVLGLRFLCPARIVGVRSHANEERSLRAMAIDTLEGHLERGREWFFLRKDHASGEVRFRAQAAWCPGDFPNAWSHLGFLLLAPRYQRAWHRLIHLRLRRIASAGKAHRGEAEMPEPPIRFYAGAVPPASLDLEREEEEMHVGRSFEKTFEPLVLGAVSGIRSMAGPAFAARRFGSRRGLARALTFLAANEFFVDKLPGIPPRTHPLSLAARAVSGALVASVGPGNRRERIVRGILGAGSAVATAFAFTRLRGVALRRSKTFGTLVALGEDALVILAQRRIAAR